MKSTSSSRRIQSKWLKDEGRSSLLRARCVKLNMIERTVPSSRSFFFKKKTILTTLFTFKIFFGSLSWTVIRSFDDVRTFMLQVKSDLSSSFHANELNLPIIEGVDGEDSTMVLVERKEKGDEFISKIVSAIDCITYSLLAAFIDMHIGLNLLLPHIVRIQRQYRSYKLRKKFNQILIKFYEPELNKIVRLLEKGIDVWTLPMVNSTQIGGNGMALEVLWLESAASLAFSRLHIAPRGIFDSWCDLNTAKELKTITRSVMLGDVAEVRLGASSHGFRTQSAKLCKRDNTLISDNLSEFVSFDNHSQRERDWHFDQSSCFSIVGSEHTLDIQCTNDKNKDSLSCIDTGLNLACSKKRFNLIDEIKGIEYSENENERTSSNLSKFSGNRDGKGFSRDWLVDMLNLLSLKALEIEEAVLRRRRWKRVNMFKRDKLLLQSTPEDLESKSLISEVKSHAISSQGDCGFETGSFNDVIANANELYKASNQAVSSSATPEKRLLSHLNQLDQIQEDSDSFAWSCNQNLSESIIREAKHMYKLLTSSLIVDEEISFQLPVTNERFCPADSGLEMHVKTLKSTLWLSEKDRRLYVVPEGSRNFNPQHSSVSDENIRCIDIDDIAEIRPCKYSMLIDGLHARPRITIVGTESSITLPVSSTELRNKLLNRFHAFIEVYKPL